MKSISLVLFIITFSLCATAQSEEKTEKSFHINVDPTELLYYFPKLSVGIEYKINRMALWTSFHYGSDVLGIKYKPRFYDDNNYKIAGIALGFKRFYSSGSGEYFMGSQIQLDKTTANVIDDVYYDIPNDAAVLFDQAQYQRSRIGLFVDYGYVFYLGERFTVEISGGAGVRRIKKWYKDIINPFELEDVEPVKFRSKSDYKHVRTEFRPAIVGSMKVGYKIF